MGGMQAQAAPNRTLLYLLSEDWRSESSVTMTTKQLGSFYLVDAQFFSPAVLRNYRFTLPDTEKSRKVVKVKVLRLIPESRSYDCQAVGVADTVKLSSKSLVHKDAPTWIASGSAK
jgi:hypothetical protein